MAMAGSAIDVFRERLKEYSDLQTTLHDVRLINLISENNAINMSNTTISSYQSDNFTSAVKKLKSYKGLVAQLTPVTAKFQSLFGDVKQNNINLENLRLRLQEAIDNARLAAEAAAAAAEKAAAQNAAAAAAALTNARNAVDKQIALLKEGKENLTAQVQNLLINENDEVTVISRTITDELTSISTKIMPGYISQQTKLLADNKYNNVNASRDNKLGIFKQLTDRFNQDSQQLQSEIDNMILALEQSKQSNALAMEQAILMAKIPEFESLKTFVEGVETVKDDLNLKIEELKDNGPFMLQLTKAINDDERIFREEEGAIEAITNQVVSFNSNIDSDIASIQARFDETDQICQDKVNGIKTSNTPLNLGLLKYQTQVLTGILGNYNQKLDEYQRSIEGIDNKIIEIQSQRRGREVNDVPSLDLTSTFKTKLDILKSDKKNRTKVETYQVLVEPLKGDMVAAISPMSRSQSPVGVSRAIVSPSPSPRSRAQSPGPLVLGVPRVIKQAWMDETDPKAKAIASLSPQRKSPDHTSSVLITRQKNYIYVPDSDLTKPNVSYLIIIPDSGEAVSPMSIASSRGSTPLSNDRVGGAGAGGSRRRNNYHLTQSGGAPVPQVFPDNAEIYRIDSDHPQFGKFISTLSSPHHVLSNRVSNDSTHIIENPTITKLKEFGHIPTQREASDVYTKIKDKLIGDDDYSVTSIAKKAVHYNNIKKLVILLDTALDRKTTGLSEYFYLWDRTWRFMRYNDGTTLILDSQFGLLTPKLKTGFKKEDQLKIVGWMSSTKNENFQNLFDVFSNCTDGGGRIKFLNDAKQITQNEYKYSFMLNWIILIAFHCAKRGKLKLQEVGMLISTIHETYLGWMEHKDNNKTIRDIFEGAAPNVRHSQKTYSKENEKNINSKIKATFLQNIINTIQVELCKLGKFVGDDSDSDSDFVHSEEEDNSEDDDNSEEEDNSEDGDDGDADSKSLLINTPSKVRPSSPPPVVSKQPSIPKLLLPTSSNGFTGRRLSNSARGGLTPAGPVNLKDFVDQEKIKSESVKNPPSDDRRRPSFGRKLKIPREQGQKPVAMDDGLFVPYGPIGSIEVPTDDTIGVPTSAVDPRHAVANQNTGNGTLPLYPTPVRLLGPPKPSNPKTVLTSPRTLKAKPPSAPRQTNGGRTKRTRKHKKYTDTSTSRRPTRRRNTKQTPEGGHKYTRKHTRT